MVHTITQNMWTWWYLMQYFIDKIESTYLWFAHYVKDFSHSMVICFVNDARWFYRLSNLLQRGLKLPRKLGLANGKNQTSISFSTLRPLHVTLFVHSILERVMRKRFIRCVFFKKDIFFWLFRSKNNLPLQDAFVCPSTGYENWGLFFLRFSTVE